MCYVVVSQSWAGRAAPRAQQIKGESMFSLCWLFPARGRLSILLTLRFAFSKAITKWQQPLSPLEVTRQETYCLILQWNGYSNCTLHGWRPRCPNSYAYNTKSLSNFLPMLFRFLYFVYLWWLFPRSVALNLIISFYGTSVQKQGTNRHTHSHPSCVRPHLLSSLTRPSTSISKKVVPFFHYFFSQRFFFTPHPLPVSLGGPGTSWQVAFYICMLTQRRVRPLAAQ